jgi:hypothetical protein
MTDERTTVTRWPSAIDATSSEALARPVGTAARASGKLGCSADERNARLDLFRVASGGAVAHRRADCRHAVGAGSFAFTAQASDSDS